MLNHKNSPRRSEWITEGKLIVVKMFLDIQIYQCFLYVQNF